MPTTNDQPGQSVNEAATPTVNVPKDSVALADNQVNVIDKIHNDQLLKDKYNIDINHLDTKSVLLLASLFHIFANEANLGADVNGNIAVGILNSGVDFGTRGESIHLSKGDIYYIQELAAGLQSGSFRNPEFNHVIFGKDVNVEIKDGQVYVNGHHMNNLKPEEVFKDSESTNYIDFAAVFQRLLKASNFYAQQEDSKGVIVDFKDQNDRFIDISKAEPIDNVIYINISYEYLQHPQPIKIYGLSSKTNGPTLVINVTGIPEGAQSINIGTQIMMYYDVDRDTAKLNNTPSINNSESHEVPNHTIWNFGDTSAEIKVNSGRFMGSVLAPNATFTAHVNVDGNIIANIVNISGGESHRWDIHPVLPPSFIEIPEQPTDPQPTDPQPTDPQPTDPQPTDPQPTDPQPTDPQPTDPQPTDPQPTDPQPTDPQPTDPQPTDPQPTDPQPTDPQPTDPQPTDPQPTDPQPTDPQPTDPQPTDPQPTDPQPTDPQPTDPQPTDPQPTDPQPTDPQPTDPQPTDPQPTDPQPTDPQPTDPQPTDPQPEADVFTEEELAASYNNNQPTSTNSATSSPLPTIEKAEGVVTPTAASAIGQASGQQEANDELPATGNTHHSALGIAALSLALTVQALALAALNKKKN